MFCINLIKAMGNAQHKSQGGSSIKRRKSSASSLTGAISKFHQKQSSSKDLSDIKDASTSASGISRSASGTDITEKNHSQFIPTERLAKVSLLIRFIKKEKNNRLKSI